MICKSTEQGYMGNQAQARKGKNNIIIAYISSYYVECEFDSGWIIIMMRYYDLHERIID